MTIDGITLNIVDTAGIRDTEDKVESIGVERAKNEIESADLILFLMDTSDHSRGVQRREVQERSCNQGRRYRDSSENP
mgnify:CR=1 FL=1